MVELLIPDVLLAGPISLGYALIHNPFAQRKDSYSLFPVDGVLSIFEESKLCIMHTAGLELQSLLETILQSQCSPSEVIMFQHQGSMQCLNLHYAAVVINQHK